MSVARFTFGPRLKAHRERQGITLQDIADSTKIGVGLLSSLERNDVSHWPKGIFRRAFLRSYTRAIDVPFEPTWAEFVQLFPEDGAAPSLIRTPGSTELRLTLAAGPRRPFAVSADNLKAASADLALVLVVATAASTVSGLSVWTCLAGVSVLYATLGTALAGGSPARRYLGLRPRQAAGSPDHSFVSDQSAPAERKPLVLDERRNDAPEQAAPPRPRIVAVPSVRNAAPEIRERRVADR